ncbi:hypothetical protein V6N13_038517 [Hibiscus sabdariffa]
MNRIIMPGSIKNHGKNWKDVDYLVFNTYIWWMNTNTMKVLSLDWNNPDGIKCALETTPILNRSMHLNVGTDLRLYVVAGNITRNMKVPNHFIDITTLSEYRKDAHTAVHTIRQGKILTPEQKADPAAYADCIHWCLPGLPDTWNEFLYTPSRSLGSLPCYCLGLPSLSTSKACVPTYIISVFFLDITTLSKYRKDAHTAVYTTGQGKFITLEHHADPATYANCIYWCLPGLP